jgi:hypothetical protein
LRKCRKPDALQLGIALVFLVKPAERGCSPAKCNNVTQNGVIQTPVTPVSSEAVTQLLSLIKKDSHSDEPNGLRHHRLIQKLANAAERSIAQQALDQNYIRLLKAANNETKPRRNTKSDILKKAGKNGEERVMKQEDPEVGTISALSIKFQSFD